MFKNQSIEFLKILMAEFPTILFLKLYFVGRSKNRVEAGIKRVKCRSKGKVEAGTTRVKCRSKGKVEAGSTRVKKFRLSHPCFLC